VHRRPRLLSPPPWRGGRRRDPHVRVLRARPRRDLAPRALRLLQDRRRARRRHRALDLPPAPHGSEHGMLIAGLQVDLVWEDREANYARLQPRIAAAASCGARLVVLPEMFPCGFSMDVDRIAEPFDGPSVQFLAATARQHGIWIAGSLPERVG